MSVPSPNSILGRTDPELYEKLYGDKWRRHSSYLEDVRSGNAQSYLDNDTELEKSSSPGRATQGFRPVFKEQSWDSSTRESTSPSGSGFFSPDGAINFARNYAVDNAPPELSDEVSKVASTFETPFRRDEPPSSETSNTIDRAVTEDPTRGVSRTVETGKIEREDRPVYTSNRAAQGISSRPTQDTDTRPTEPSGLVDFATAAQATQGIGGSAAPTVARATQGLGAWYNKGRNVRIPNESTAGWGELWRDNQAQGGMSKQNWQQGKQPGFFGRPDRSVLGVDIPESLKNRKLVTVSAAEGGPGSAPTPLVRQVGERILGPIATGASIFAQGQEGSALDQTVRTAAENQISWLPSSDARQNEGDIGRRASEFLARQAGNARDWFVDKLGNVKKGVTKDESGQAVGFGTVAPETYWEGGRQFEVQPEVYNQQGELVAPEGRTEITDPWSMENLEKKGFVGDGTLVAGGQTLYGDTDYGLQDDGTLGTGDDDWGSDIDVNELENLGLGIKLAKADTGKAEKGFLDNYIKEPEEVGLLSQNELKEKYGDPYDQHYSGYFTDIKYDTDEDGRLYYMKPDLEWTQEGGVNYKDWYKVYKDEEEPSGNYIKNEDTGEVTKVGGSKPGGINTGTTTDLNPQSSQPSQPTAREHNRKQGAQWTSGYYRDQSVDNIIRDGYSQSEANQIKAHIAEGDRIEAQANAMDSQIDTAFKEYQRKTDYALNYLGGKTAGTQDEYNEAMRRYAAADAASARWNALLEQQMEIRSRGSKHTDALSQYL